MTDLNGAARLTFLGGAGTVTGSKILLEYNQLLIDDPRVETVLLPIRDGLTVSRVL